MKFLKRAVSVLLAAATAITAAFAGSVTAGARTVTKTSDGSTRVSYDSGDWRVVYDPSASWTTNTAGTISASLFRQVLEIHMPGDYYDLGFEQVSKGNIFEIVAGNPDNYFGVQFHPGNIYSVGLYFNGKWFEEEWIEACNTEKEIVDDGYSDDIVYSKQIVKLLLKRDCSDSVIQCIENGLKSGVYVTASCFKDFGDPPFLYLIEGEKVSYSVRGSGSGESASSQIAPKKTTLTAKRSGEKIKLSWKKVDGTEKYQIYYREKGESKYKKLATVSGGKTSYSTSKLDKNKTYQFKIRSYKESNGKKVYSKFSKVITVK